MTGSPAPWMMRQTREGTGVIRVRVLGSTEISIGQRRIGMNTELLFALALYLTTRAGERMPRSELVERFWPAGSGEQRRHALRQLLYRLRQKGVTLAEDGDWIVAAPSLVSSDLRDALADGWPERATAEEIDCAAEFVPRFSSRIAPAFHEWLEGVLNRLAMQHRKASLGQIALARREGRWGDLDRWANSVLVSDPLNEEAVLASAESAAMAGSKSAALEILDKYLEEIAVVSQDLGRPAAQLRRRIAERRPDWGMRGPKEVSVIGRAELMSRLTALVDAAWRGEGGAVILAGAPGIGKTRLALEARAYADLKGMRSLLVRSEAANSERPLGLVQALVDSLLDLPGTAGCDPDSLRLLRQVTEQHKSDSHRDAVAFMSSVRDALQEAIQDLLEAILHESRLLVILDDMHNADGPSLLLLANTMKSLRGTRLCWIATSRRTGQSDSGANAVRSSATTLNVAGLELRDAEMLSMATAAAHSICLPSQVAQFVAAATAGNPLFVRELSLARGRNPNDQVNPRSLQHLMEDRLGQLTVEQLRTVRVVALLGADATLSRLRTLVRLDHPALTQTIEALEADGLFHLTDRQSLALHECWQQAVLESLTQATRASLSYECATALENSEDGARDPRVLWRTAELYREGGASRRAVELYEAAAEQLFCAGFPDEAATVLQRVSGLVESTNERTRVLSRLARAHMAAGNPPKVLAVSNEVLGELAPPYLGIDDEVCACLCVRADALMRLRLNFDAELEALESLALDESISHSTRQLVCLTGIRVAVNERRTAALHHFYASSRRLSAAHGPSMLGSLVGLIFLTEEGPLSELMEEHEVVGTLHNRESSVTLRLMALRFRCHSLRLAGQTIKAIAEGQRAYSLARTHSNAHDAQLAAELLAFLYLDQAECERARDWIDTVTDLQCRHQYAERTVAVSHAADRLEMQSGAFAAVVSRSEQRLEAIRNDRRPSSRAAELATLAYCLAQVGRDRSAEGVLAETYGAAEPLVGTFSGDYPVELIARTCRSLGNHRGSEEITESHLRAARKKLERPLPVFYEELRSAEARLGPRAG